MTPPQPTQVEKRRNSRLEEHPALVTRPACGGPHPPSRNQGGLRRRRGSSLATEVEEVLADPLGLGEWPSHEKPPLGRGCAGSQGGAGRGLGPRSPQAAQPGWAAGAPAGPGRALSAAAPLWEGASPGTRWRGKGGIAGARHAERPRSACNAAGGGAGGGGDTASPPPPPGHRMRPPADDPAPLWPRRLCLAAAASASLRRAPAAAAAENGCQSGASRHATTGGGRAPRPARSPAPFRVPALSARAPGPSWAPGNLGPQRGARGEGEGRLPARGGGGEWRVTRGQYQEGALCPSPPPPHSACPVPSRGRGARVGQC